MLGYEGVLGALRIIGGITARTEPDSLVLKWWYQLMMTVYPISNMRVGEKPEADTNLIHILTMNQPPLLV